jgi:hypothetical protein
MGRSTLLAVCLLVLVPGSTVITDLAFTGIPDTTGVVTAIATDTATGEGTVTGAAVGVPAIEVVGDSAVTAN